MPRATGKRLATRDAVAGLLLTAILAASAFLVWRLATAPPFSNPYGLAANAAASALPHRLGPVRPIYFDVSPDTFQSILAMGLDRHVCGGVIFEMSESVERQIADEGVGFFADAREPGDLPDGGHRERYAYEPWRETPWPEEWFFEGALSGGFGCMDLDRETRSAVTAHARSPGSYYSRSAEYEVLVVPARRLVLLTMQD